MELYCLRGPSHLKGAQRSGVSEKTLVSSLQLGEKLLAYCHGNEAGDPTSNWGPPSYWFLFLVVSLHLVPSGNPGAGSIDEKPKTSSEP